MPSRVPNRSHELAPEELTRHVGRLTSKPKSTAATAARDGANLLAQKIGRLEERDRRLVESMVDQMLELE